MAQLIFYQIHLAAILRIHCRVARAATRRPVSWLLHFLGEITHQVPARSEWYLGSNEVGSGGLTVLEVHLSHQSGRQSDPN